MEEEEEAPILCYSSVSSPLLNDANVNKSVQLLKKSCIIQLH